MNRDITKLPKWAQKYIEEIRGSTSKTGANIENVHIENVGIKHNEDTTKAIIAITESVKSSNEVLINLASCLNGCSKPISFEGHGISLSNVKADNES